MNKLTKYGPLVLRIGLASVFLWFSINQFMSTDMWIRIVPAWATSLFGSAVTVVHLNAWFELVVSLMLLVGLQTRWIALILTLHLGQIAFGFGLSATGVRDWGLCIAALSIFFSGADVLSLDHIWQHKNQSISTS